MAARSNSARAGSRSQQIPASSPAPSANTLQKATLQMLPRDAVQVVNSAIPACIRRDMIEQLAYFKAQERGFAPGREVDDWLAAEREIDALIRERYR